MEQPINIVIEEKRLAVDKLLLEKHSQYFKAMFHNHFQEDFQQDIQLKAVDFDHFQDIINLIKNLVTIENFSDERLIEVLKVSDMFQFSEIQQKCSSELSKRIDKENCWTLLSVSDLVSDEFLRRKSEHFILWHFDETMNDPGFSAINAENLLKILSDARLNVSSESKVINALVNWCSVNHCRDKLEILLSRCVDWDQIKEQEMELLKQENIPFPVRKMDEDSPRRKTVKRKLPVLPCVVGFSQQKSKEQKENYFEILSWSVEGLLSIGPLENESQEQFSSSIQGFKVASKGTKLFMSGGEWSLGHSNWNKDVLVWDSLTKVWSRLTTLHHRRRHHSALIISNKMFLFGGFGKHRVILDSVVSIDLETGEQVDCANLPQAMYSPAVASINKQTVVLVGMKSVWMYNIDKDSWSQLTVSIFPENIDFDKAVHHEATGKVFLASRFSHMIYALKLTEPSCCEITEEVKMTGEALNICLVEGELYNFYSEKFSDEKIIESYNIDSYELKLLLVLKSDSDFDFLANNCLGCFPLVVYDDA